MANAMKRKLGILYAIFGMLFFGAYGFSDPVQYEADEVIRILEAKDNRSVQSGEKIKHIIKVNMGIPGGENWLAVWSGVAIICYSINDGGEVVSRYNMNIASDLTKYTRFDIMEYIPGIRVGDSSCTVGDYNSDGYDEVLSFVFGGSNWGIAICGYDSKKNDFVYFAYVPFYIIDPENGPSPLEFIKYKGVDGFQVYYGQFHVFDGPSYVEPPDPKNQRWFFYAWDEGKREYVEVEEVDPRYVEAYTAPVPRQLPVAPPPVAAVEEPPGEAAVVTIEQPEETVLAVVEDGGKNGNFVIIIVIIAGVAATAGAVVFLAIRRKKR